MGGCLPSTLHPSGESKERRAVEVTDYEILSLVIAGFSLLIGVVALLLKLFALLDSSYKRK